MWRRGDLCECFYDGDQLWYIARVDEEDVEGTLAVTLVGYELAMRVPANW